MRGVKNQYHAVPVMLFGQVVRHDLLVNNVPVARVYRERDGITIQQQPGTIRLDKKRILEVIR